MKSLISVVLLVVALTVLAVLQFRWIGEIGEADRQRLENGVRDSGDRFARDFVDELSRIPRTFEERGFIIDQPQALIERYREWLATAPHPGLIRNVYLMDGSPTEGIHFLRVNVREDVSQGATIPVTLPPELDFPNYLVLPRGIVFELDPVVLTRDVFPTLDERYFAKPADRTFRIAVVNGTEKADILYSSGESWSDDDVAEPDYAMDLIGFAPGPPRDEFRGERGPRSGPRRGGPPPQGRGPGLGPGNGPNGPRQGGRGPAPLFQNVQGGRLRLLVKHEAGSVEIAVNQARQRNLAVSFGILLVLAGAAFTVVMSSRRARNLGRMQVEFAAGVSHELRTPLAVIQSAAHNLRAGVIRDPEAIEQYAGLVQSEARRLSDMVEQVMAYAETQSGKKRYEMSAADVQDVVEQALRNTPLPSDADLKVEIEQRIPENLPPALADPMALSQCVHNLLSNALKYGRHDNKVVITVEGVHDNASGKIHLRVIDHGGGVPADALGELFEPFHRGRNVTGAPGNGLGLHLVQMAMKAQNGSVNYSPTPGGGATFTLTIPVAHSNA